MKTLTQKILMILTFIFLSVQAQAQAHFLRRILAHSKTGTYEVPVTDEALKSAAVFELKKISYNKTGDQFKLKYLMPVELTGEENLVEFKGTIVDGQGSLVYQNNKMDCLTDQTTLMCKVAYQNLNINQLKAEDILKKKFSGEELTKKLTIQRDFSTDPVGIVKIKLK
jgi:hypothetical protein